MREKALVMVGLAALACAAVAGATVVRRGVEGPTVRSTPAPVPPCTTSVTGAGRGVGPPRYTSVYVGCLGGIDKLVVTAAGHILAPPDSQYGGVESTQVSGDSATFTLAPDSQSHTVRFGYDSSDPANSSSGSNCAVGFTVQAFLFGRAIGPPAPLDLPAETNGGCYGRGSIAIALPALLGLEDAHVASSTLSPDGPCTQVDVLGGKEGFANGTGNAPSVQVVLSCHARATRIVVGVPGHTLAQGHSGGNGAIVPGEVAAAKGSVTFTVDPAKEPAGATWNDGVSLQYAPSDPANDHGWQGSCGLAVHVALPGVAGGDYTIALPPGSSTGVCTTYLGTTQAAGGSTTPPTTTTAPKPGPSPSGKHRYVIDELAVDDRDLNARKNALEAKIERARAAAARATSAAERARHMLDLRSADAVHVGAALQALIGERDAAAFAFAEFESRFPSGEPRDESQKETGIELSIALRRAEEQVARKQRLYEHTLADERAAAAASTKAAADEDSARKALGDLRVEQLRLARLSSLSSVRVTADGRTVFAATSAHAELADRLQPVLDGLAELQDDYPDAASARDRAEAALLAASDRVAAANANLVEKIWLRGEIGFAAALGSGAKEVISGAVEGGPWGAFMAAISFALKEKASQALSGDEDLAAQISAALDRDGRIPSYAQPTVGAVMGDAATDQLTSQLIGPVPDTIATLAASTADEIEKYVRLPSPAQNTALHMALSKSISVEKRLTKELTKLGDDLKALGTKQRWKELLGGKDVTKLKVGGTVVDIAGAAAKSTAKVLEAQAWADFLVAGRVETQLRQVYVRASENFWKLKKTYDALLAAEARLLNETKTSRSGFRIESSVPFAEGATLTITSTPSLGSFAAASGAVGGRRADRAVDRLELVAREFLGSGGDPEPVVLELTVGGKKT